MSHEHDLINYERKRRGIPNVYWSREMARLARSQANHCARVSRLVHSNRFAFQGGEILAGGTGNFSPRTIVDCWLNSKAGHREYLLSPRVRKAGVGIARSGGKTFVAWAFSDAPPSYPDCPWYKPPKPKAVKGPSNKLLHQPSRKQSLSQVAKLKKKIEYIVKYRQIPRWLIKLCLSLVILGGFTFLVSYSYSLFIQHSVDAPTSSILFIVGIAAWLFVFKLSQRKQYRRTKPSFKATTFSVIVILLVLAFAGVQPLSGYKDNVIGKLTTKYDNYQMEVETKRLVKEAEMTAAGVKDEWEFYKEYVTIFNEFRQEKGAPPLTFVPYLNGIASKRVPEIRSNFSHKGVPYNVGENIAEGASYPEYLLEIWAESPRHRANMLSLRYSTTGFATDGTYSVQLFQ